MRMIGFAESEQHGDAGNDVPLLWSKGAQRSFIELVAYIAQQPYGDPVACARDILAALVPLRVTPPCIVAKQNFPYCRIYERILSHP